jgi:hypothetical protein
MSNRFRRLTDLFVKGRVLQLPDRGDGTPSGYLWVQIINSYERDECLSDAQVARSRLVLALREKGDERIKVEARVAERGRQLMAEDLAELRMATKTAEIAEGMRSDPEWKERVEIVLRQDEDTSYVPEPEEEAQLARINMEVLQELAKREDTEKEFLIRKYTRLSDEEFVSEWIDEWIERRGSMRAANEYKLTEIWCATRWCNAVPTEAGGNLDHSRCEGHREKVFATKADARAADDLLLEMIKDVLNDLTIGGQDPKDSASPPSSSDSSPTPSEPEASTPSTSSATPTPVPGT